MGIIDAAFDSIGGVFSDQWKDVITAGHFDEHTLVTPGVRRNSQNGRGGNYGAEDILSNGSIIYVPENTAAFVFSQVGIEQVITTPGGYEYRNGQATVFDEKDRAEGGLGRIFVQQAAERIGFGGMSPDSKRVAFVNLRTPNTCASCAAFALGHMARLRTTTSTTVPTSRFTPMA